MWKTFPEFKSPATSYQDFKKAILKYYPNAAGDFIYSLQDMDILVGECLRNGIISPKDLLDYHMQFSAITTWLIEKGQLGHLEQQRACVRAFQPQLLKAVIDRLQLKHQNHHPSTPYKIEDIFDAARFVLQSTTTNYLLPDTSAPTNNTTETTIKKEELSALFPESGKTITEALNMNANRPHNGNTGNRTSNTGT